MRLLGFVAALCISVGVQANEYIMGGYDLFSEMGLDIIEKDIDQNLAIAFIPEGFDTEEVAHEAHHYNRCGGFEWVTDDVIGDGPSPLQALLKRMNRPKSLLVQEPIYSREVADAIEEVDSDQVGRWIELISSLKTRYHKSKNRNDIVELLQNEIDMISEETDLEIIVDTIEHRRTQQLSVRATIVGTERPDEVVVFGGHLDSINSRSFGREAHAPGADDNASGSAVLLEVLRIVSQKEAPQRSIQFFWYGAEEAGLIGSGEIAASYESQGVDVVSVTQFDMTAYPGSGVGTIGSMTDFTSASFREYFGHINGLYLDLEIIEDKCGYGCSDHASWYRKGYATLMPFETSFSQINRAIHTHNDTIDRLDFEHAGFFAKVGVALALDVANSDVVFED